ncbi:MAG TPA: hypothetical protein VEQ42_13010 [Pyrinomonadaceae bacterium]|nr:hypothetical protein [Pyrinomonadaceae bacterium]
MENFMSQYFLGCLWLAGMYAVAVRRFEKGRELLIFASLPLVVITLTAGLALLTRPDTAFAALVVVILIVLLCLVAGAGCLLGVLLSVEPESRRHFAIATLMFGGPVLLFPFTVVLGLL